MAKVVKKEKKPDLKDLFDFTKAGFSKPNMQRLKTYYTRVIAGVMNAKGKIVLMNPEEALDNCYHAGLKGWKKKAKSYNDAVFFEKKYKEALPVIDITRKITLGTSRMVICYNHGLKVPVLVVGETIKDIDKWLKAKKIGVSK